MCGAVGCAEEAREQIENTQVELRDALARSVVRWTSPEQFHLTLKFLGGVEVARVADLETALQRAVGGLNAFHLSAGGIGVFPNLRRAEGILAGANTPRTEVTGLFPPAQEEARRVRK